MTRLISKQSRLAPTKHDSQILARPYQIEHEIPNPPNSAEISCLLFSAYGCETLMIKNNMQNALKATEILGSLGKYKGYPEQTK